ncbi:hypothetical protein [Asticcacaulis sp. AC402]|uniref:hypothetical protein n=1 Tax=Asticcacaulis sp. AC402 TaxID=1282361 RepID=UPI0003C408CA|nr:hypothetical protein [Asticcacaulis sp. AC402]ESQ76670.1 hypothetical protein ABAC402_03065 [Asticcacaulis sp. AC402]
MRQRNTTAAIDSLAKGLSGNARKEDVKAHSGTEGEAVPAPLVEDRSDIRRRPAGYNRSEFYLKIDGLSGPRPARDGRPD